MSVLEYVPKGKVTVVVSFISRKILGIWGLNVREGPAFLCPNKAVVLLFLAILNLFYV